jgi:drug/metabolite transporter (DMT)-like permease
MLSRLSPFPRGTPAPPSASPAHGIGLMLLAMLLFSTSDVVAKLLTARLDPVQIVWGRYLFNSALVAALVAARLFPSPAGASRPGLQLARGAGMLGSAVIFVFALGSVPVAMATAVGFVSPLFIMALSIPVLGERVGWRRWTAAAVGFTGVLVVARPGAADFNPTVLLPLASAACWAVAIVLTRKMGEGEAPERTYSWTVLSGLAGASLLVPVVWVAPTAAEWGLLAVLGLLAGLGHYAVLRACLYLPASALAPLSYSQMVWALALGFAVFSTVPDGMTLLGAAVIVGSGVYIALRERRVGARQPAFGPPALDLTAETATHSTPVGKMIPQAATAGDR